MYKLFFNDILIYCLKKVLKILPSNFNLKYFTEVAYNGSSGVIIYTQHIRYLSYQLQLRNVSTIMRF